MKKVLILGMSGFLGRRLAIHLGGRYRIEGTHHSRPALLGDLRSFSLDLGKPRSALQALERSGPDILINATAIQGPPSREHPALAMAVNAEAPGWIAAWCSRKGIPMIHFSTDLVFDGTLAPYAETAPPDPLSLYGRTKRQGEASVMEAHPGALVLRLSLLCGREGGFVGWMEERLKTGREAGLFTDQYRTPLYIGEVGPAVDKALEQSAPPGLYHLGGPDRISRYDYGTLFASRFGYPKHLLRPIRMQDLEDDEARPPDASLDSGKIIRTLGLRCSGVKEGMARMMEEQEWLHRP